MPAAPRDKRQAPTFWETIHQLRKDGKIPRIWTRADIRPHLKGRYERSTIDTVPSNQSMTRDGSVMGDYVKKGLAAMAWRVARGRFELINDPAADDSERANSTNAMIRTRRVSVMLEYNIYMKALALARERRTELETLVCDALVQQLNAASHDAAPFEMRINHTSRPIGALSPADIAAIERDDDLLSSTVRP